MSSTEYRDVAYVQYRDVLIPYQANKVCSHVFCVLVGFDYAFFYNFSIGYWKCSDSVVLFFFFILLVLRVFQMKGNMGYSDLDCMIDCMIYIYLYISAQ